MHGNLRNGLRVCAFSLRTRPGSGKRAAITCVATRGRVVMAKDSAGKNGVRTGAVATGPIGDSTSATAKSTIDKWGSDASLHNNGNGLTRSLPLRVLTRWLLWICPLQHQETPPP